MVGIHVERWSFWSPEASDPGNWLAYRKQNGTQTAPGNPDVAAIPPQHRRRMSRLSKMALAAALDATAGEAVDYSVFCSRHGEIVRAWEILSSISAGTEISPAAFAQSVHNTSSGLYTIIESSNAPSMSMASGANSFAYAWMEASAYLAANADHSVLLVDFDEVIPREYQKYVGQVDCDHALALILRSADGNGISMTRSTPASDDGLPQGPQFLAWLQSGAESLSLTAGRQAWQWQR